MASSYILSSKFNLLKNYNIYDLNTEIFYVSIVFSLIYLIYRFIYSVSVIVYRIKLFKDKNTE